jgi:hypothetical protein
MPATAWRMDAGLGEAALMPAWTRRTERPGAECRPGAAETARRGRDIMARLGQHDAAGIRLGRDAGGRNMETEPRYGWRPGDQDVAGICDDGRDRMSAFFSSADIPISIFLLGNFTSAESLILLGQAICSAMNLITQPFASPFYVGRH